MVIVTANGYQDKEKCNELLKIIKNKKVFVCTNAIERDLLKKKHFEILKENVDGFPLRFDGGDLTSDIAYKWTDYYDCIYIAGGSLRNLSEMLDRKEIKDSLLKFVNRGKILITEGLASLIVCNNLDYVNDIVASLDEENDIYKSINYSSINTLNLTKEKIIVFFKKLPKHFQGACKVAEKLNRISLTILKENEFAVK